MRRTVFFLVVAALAALLAVYLRSRASKQQEDVFEPANKPPPLAPMCPWRHPEADLPKLVPGGSRYDLHTHILSGMRPELAQRLGRAPAADENALQVYHIYGAEGIQGDVVTRRVKGSYGAIELVIAADGNHRLKSIHIQRLREPQAVTQALLGTDWARWLGGKTAESSWNCEQLMARLPPEARASAEAIVAGARSSIILLAASSHTLSAELTHSHQH